MRDWDGAYPTSSRPSPPHWTNGWGRWITSEFEHLEEAIDDHEARLRALERPPAGIGTHTWRIGLAAGAVLAHRATTGEWLSPLEIAALFGGG